MPQTRHLLRRASAALGLAAFLAIAGATLWFVHDGRTITRFDSPSGKRRFFVAEDCLGHACAHSAYIEERSMLWPNRRECHFVLIGDGIAFEHGSVTWNAAETALDWYTPTFNTEGHIDFEQDCTRR